MRLILDEDLPKALTTGFAAEHDVVHVDDLGWKGLRNGALLSRVSGRFDVLITGDTNMRFQQNLSGFDVAVVVLRPRLKLIDQLQELVPAALDALENAPKGQATLIEAD